jgi:NAD(P)-dependent dehydrogenase (short-subunit alcohol dehydrogenase family)
MTFAGPPISADTTDPDSPQDPDSIDARAAANDAIGFSRVGYEMRAPSFDDNDLGHIAGRTVVISGATAGLGRAAAQRLAELGARVVVLARDEHRGRQALTEIEAETGNSNLALVVCDVSSLESVRQAAAVLLADEREIHVLINNAGVLLNERQYSADGYDLVLATNLLGPFLLAELLRERIVASAPARIIEVSSGGMYYQRINVVDPQTENGDYVGTEVYSRTKRGQVMVTEIRAEQLAGTGVVCHSMHPGWAATPGVSSSIPLFEKKFRDVLRTPAQGADTIVWLAAADAPAHSSGQFWLDRRPRETYRTDATRETAEEREALWLLCRRMTGLDR